MAHSITRGFGSLCQKNKSDPSNGGILTMAGSIGENSAVVCVICVLLYGSHSSLIASIGDKDAALVVANQAETGRSPHDRTHLVGQSVPTRRLLRGRDPYSRTQITQITAGFSPIDPASMTIQPLDGSDLSFWKKLPELRTIDGAILHSGQSVKILLLSA